MSNVNIQHNKEESGYIGDMDIYRKNKKRL